MLKVIGWVDYDNIHFASAKGTEEEINAVADNIRENGYKFGGDDHENRLKCCPLLSNGQVLRMSWRGWGYVMAVAYDIKTDAGEYNYILWYMGEYGPEERVFPSSEPVRLTEGPKGKTFVYEVSKEEYHAINNASFCNFVLPEEYCKRIGLKTFDIVSFTYQNRTLLETIVNENRFVSYTFEEFFSEDTYVHYFPNSDTNFRDFTAEQLKKFLSGKYNTEVVKVISIYFEILSDHRNAQEIYA